MRVYSSASATLLFELDSAHLGMGPNSNMGDRLRTIGDLDGDGKRDLMMTAGHFISGCCHFHPQGVIAVSSANGSLLMWDHVFALYGHDPVGNAGATPAQRRSRT